MSLPYNQPPAPARHLDDPIVPSPPTLPSYPSSSSSYGPDDKTRPNSPDEKYLAEPLPLGEKLAGTPTPEDENVEESEFIPPPPVIAWKYKWFALLAICTFSIGQTWTDAAMSPLKATLRTELGINNTQYGLISSAEGVINCLWPIVGGTLLDWFGVNVVSLSCTGTMVVGSLIAALGPQLGHWRLIVGGHLLMGFGQALLDGAQHKLFYHWFGAGGLALSMGVELGVSRATSFTAGITAIPIKNQTGFYGWSFWVPVFLCLGSFLTNVAYVVFQASIVPPELRLHGARQAALKKKRNARINWKILWYLPWAFWFLPLTQLFQSGAVKSFTSSSTDLVTMRGYKEVTAAYTTQGSKILPMLASPLIGLAVDRWGGRFIMMAIAPLLWIIAMATIQFSDVHPLLPVIIGSLASCIQALPFQFAMPLLVRDQQKIGTALGVWKCLNNAGSTILSIVFGQVQDRDGDYRGVISIGIGLKTWAFFVGVGYCFLDRYKLGGVGNLGEKARMAKEEAVVDPTHDPLTARPVSRLLSCVGIAVISCMAAATIAMFCVFLV